MPTLQNAAITYFNPQVDEWFPELIEVEEQAKMTASLLLFVVDNQTRAISSMVEIAYLAGQSYNPLYLYSQAAPPPFLCRSKGRGGSCGGRHLC